jgi:hypothetical protein
MSIGGSHTNWGSNAPPNNVDTRINAIEERLDKMSVTVSSGDNSGANATPTSTVTLSTVVTDVRALVAHPSILLLEKLVLYVVGAFGAFNPTSSLPTNVREAIVGGAAGVLAFMNHGATVGRK